MNCLYDFFRIADTYQQYLINHGFEFDSQGRPLFKREMFLEIYPELVIPYDFRNSRVVQKKNETLICFYCSDKRIYPRLDKVMKDISEYKKYKGVIAADISVGENMDTEFQKSIILLNQLFMAVLAVNGIKIVANLRFGDKESLDMFSNMPKNIIWATGFLGCKKDEFYDNRFISSILHTQPSKLIIYGKDDFMATNRLNTMGFDFRIFPDYHKLSKELYEKTV